MTDHAGDERAPAPVVDADPAPRALERAVRFSLVVPVYGNEGSIPALLEAIAGIAGRLDDGFEAVFVVDGSPDDSAAVLAHGLPDQPFASQVVHLSRNFGSFAAIRAGLEVVSGAYVAVMAADLQEPPELMDQFYALLAADEADIVVGERTARADSSSTKLGSSVFWSLFRRFVQPDMPAGGVDIFGCNDQVRRAIVGMREANISLVGLLIWMGFRRVGVPYERRERLTGKSGWTFSKKVRYMADSVFSFTDLPIRLLLFTGVIGLLGTILASIVVFIGWATRRIEVPGYTPLMLALLIVSGLMLCALGIIGSYVWRTYENTKQRPITLVQSTQHFTGRSADD